MLTKLALLSNLRIRLIEAKDIQERLNSLQYNKYVNIFMIKLAFHYYYTSEMLTRFHIFFHVTLKNRILGKGEE